MATGDFNSYKGKFGYWHWLPMLLLTTVISSLFSYMLPRFILLLGLSIRPALWMANIFTCLFLYGTRILWIASTCERYSRSTIYRVYTYAVQCFLVCFTCIGTLSMDGLPSGLFSSNPATDGILSRIYPLTPIIVMCLSFAYARNHIKSTPEIRNH